jgi:hypothetical protein
LHTAILGAREVLFPRRVVWQTERQLHPKPVHAWAGSREQGSRQSRPQGKFGGSETAASWPIYAERVALRADSILIQLADDEFAEGLVALRTYAATTSGTVTEPTDLFAFRKQAGAT